MTKTRERGRELPSGKETGRRRERELRKAKENVRAMDIRRARNGESKRD